MEKSEFLLEEKHLHETVALVQMKLDLASKESESYADAIRSIQEERMESNRMGAGGMYSAQGFADLLELSQGAQALHQMVGVKENNERSIRMLLRMRDAPYFARIDFRFADGRTRQVYIGRATLMEDESMNIHVYDWRVPIASVFYQYGVGPAQYEAPVGVIEGEVLLKRQYEIRSGELLYYFDVNEEILDSFLRELLSKPAAPTMKSIVETIQRDQDRIIRDMQTDLLMVQGCAGSGKTSVALHRVAYLMYQGLQKGRLSPNEILILAPNATFEQYISRVLPDLGEKQVQTMLPEDLLTNMLPGTRIEPRSVWVERFLAEPNDARRRSMRKARSLKGSNAFLRLLDRLCDELPRKWIPFCDVDYNGQRVAFSDLSQVSICNPRKKAPLGRRLRMLEKSILENIRALRPARYEKLLDFAASLPHHAMEINAFARMLSIRESGRLLAQIHSFTRIDCAAVYCAMFTNKERFSRLAAGLLPAEAIEPLRLETLSHWNDGVLPYEDAAAIAYLTVRVNGCRAYSHFRQVVVDEAQDLDTLHAQLLKILFPNARFTFLGDIHQTLTGLSELSLYDDLQAALNKPNSLLIKLDKSFRCTREIWAFGARFLPSGAAGACFSRSGETPTLHSADSEKALTALLLTHARQCLQSGHRSIALLCKTERDAQLLYERLKGEKDIAWVGENSTIENDRISILSLYRAKGLEFDVVLLYGVDAARYHDSGDKNLLYIGCMRALHVLRLFYTGEKSPLLETGKEVNP